MRAGRRQESGCALGSLSALFDLSRSALTADQAALNATANNVANQNTAGYTQQVVSFQAGDTVTLSAAEVRRAGRRGRAPVETTTSLRDRVLEQRVQQQTQTQAETSARADVLGADRECVQRDGSSATTGSTQIGTDLNSFFSSLTALAGNPADAATQQGVLSAARALANDFNAAASQLTDVKAQVSSEHCHRQCRR